MIQLDLLIDMLPVFKAAATHFEIICAAPHLQLKLFKTFLINGYHSLHVN